MPKKNYFSFLKLSSTSKPLASLWKLTFVRSLLGTSSLTKIKTPPQLRFLFSLYGKEKPSIWNWEFENVLSNLVLHTTKIPICFKTNSFSWVNVNEIEFIFIYPIIVLLPFFNFKFFISDRGFKSCLFFRFESLFSELLSRLPLSTPLFCFWKCLSLQATSFQNYFKIKCLI